MKTIKKYNKKADLRSIIFILCSFGIALLLIIFYSIAIGSIKTQSKTQSQIITTDLELKEFFTEFTNIHSSSLFLIEEDEIEDLLIKDYTKLYEQQGTYSNEANCNKEEDKIECEIIVLVIQDATKQQIQELNDYQRILLQEQSELKNLEQTTIMPKQNFKTYEFKLRTIIKLMEIK